MADKAETTNDFPKLGINTDELLDWVNWMLKKAAQEKEHLGAVNWGDLGVTDIEYRLSMLRPDDDPSCVVRLEEASPDSKLSGWLYGFLDKTKFPNTYFECEW